MGKKKKEKNDASAGADPQSELRRARAENEALRARLEKIAELASDLPGAARDVEDEEYEELTHDVDDQIASGKDRPKS